MKCVKHISHTETTPMIFRTTDTFARELIAGGGWQFCPRHLWKASDKLYIHPATGMTSHTPPKPSK